MLNPNLKDFWKTKARTKVLYGGRASSKTYDTAGVAVALSTMYKLKILCTRQFQNRISESVYSTIKTQITNFNLDNDFEITNNRILNKSTKSEFIFLGIWRNIDEIKSLEGVDICWIEEAHNLKKEQWQIIEPTIRKENSEIWITFNPKLVSDFVYQNFIINTPKNTIIRKINYNENPFLSNTILEIINEAYEKDLKEALHVYEGEPKINDDDSIIKRDWILASIDAHKKLNLSLEGKKIIGFDVADGGEDYNAICLRHGCVVVGVEQWKSEENELKKNTLKVYNKAKQTNSDIIFDSIGVGAGVGSELKSLGDVKFTNFVASAKVVNPESFYEFNIKNKDMFSNLKAQLWWQVANRFKNSYNAINKNEKSDDVISISSNVKFLNKLINELCEPKKDFDFLGKVKVESKKDLKKRNVDSTNLADSLIMAFADITKKSALLETN